MALKTVAIVMLPVIAVLSAVGGCDRRFPAADGTPEGRLTAKPADPVLHWQPDGHDAARFLREVAGFADRAPDSSLLAAVEPFLKTSVCRRIAGAMHPADIRSLLSRKPISVGIKGYRFVVNFNAPSGCGSTGDSTGEACVGQSGPAILRQPLVLYYSDGTFRIDLDASSRFRPIPSTDPSPQNVAVGLSDAIDDLPGSGPLLATLAFDNGITVKCRLLTDSAPENVAAFIALARGLRNTKAPADMDSRQHRTNVPAGVDVPATADSDEPVDGSPGTSWIKRPWYDGMTVGRALNGAAISFGRIADPGFLLPDEFDIGVRHDRPGLLTTLPDRPEWGNGAIAITRAAIPEHNDRGTIIGNCDYDSVSMLFSDFAIAEREKRQVHVQGITFLRNQ